MRRSDIVLIGLFAACAALIVVFGIPGIVPFADQTLGELVAGVVPRLAAGGFLLVLMGMKGYRESLLPAWKGSHLLWALPCLLVAVVNFPFTALIGGSAHVDRPDLVWLFVLDCFAIALLEELFFRALLLPLVVDCLRIKHRLFFATVLTAAVFGLSHLVNLFFGADVGATFLQVGYTFLLGCMFGAMLLFTKNVWLCVLVHFIFDIGGTLIPTLGGGAFQDTTFWILTVIAGVLCAVHVVVTFFFLDKKDRPDLTRHSERSEESRG